MDSASAAVQNESFSPPRLEVTDIGEHRVVHLNGHRIALYPREDRLTERVIVTQLVEVSGLHANRVAEIFERHFVTVSRWRGLVRAAGALALVPERPGPKGPSKRTQKLEGKNLRLRSQGLSYQSIAERVTREGLKVSHTLVAAVIREHEKVPSLRNPHPALYTTHRRVPRATLAREGGARSCCPAGRDQPRTPAPARQWPSAALQSQELAWSAVVSTLSNGGLRLVWQ